MHLSFKWLRLLSVLRRMFFFVDSLFYLPFIVCADSVLGSCFNALLSVLCTLCLPSS